MADFSTPWELLNNSDAITMYIDRVIQKSLEYETVFTQMADMNALGRNDENSPADFIFQYIEKTSKGFTVTETRPGALAEQSIDAYEIKSGEIKIYSGQIQTPYELSKMQKWNIKQDMLNDMAEQAALDFDASLGVFLTSNVTDVAETNSGAFTFPDDILKLKKAVYQAHKRQPDVLYIGTNIEDKLLKLDNFIEASKYGSNTPLLNGEIGKLYGLRIVSTPYLDQGGIDGSSPTNDTMLCLRMTAKPLRVEYWQPLYRFYEWYDNPRHVYINELRAFYKARLFDATAIRQMKI